MVSEWMKARLSGDLGLGRVWAECLWTKSRGEEILWNKCRYLVAAALGGGCHGDSLESGAIYG